MSAATAEEIRVADGGLASVTTAHGTITLPVAITDMPDRVVWVPRNSPGSTVFETLRARVGDVVGIAAWGYPR
ncbi:hypothetical protein MTP03_10270 [Tsukamurella sp. PLM1]|nr:hypothetical protein MTP03_10270 [Tsukamurella sp. PLM1]